MRALLSRLSAPPTLTLLTHQPTSSTAKYTITTRPQPASIVARLYRLLDMILRIFIGVRVVLSIWMKWSITYAETRTIPAPHLGSTLDAILRAQVEDWKWEYTLPVALFVLWLVFRRGYTEESLTVLRGLGIQTSTSSSTYLLGATKRFIPTTSIQDIVIYEAFKGFEVRFYLAVIVEGEGDVIVVFDKLLPRRAILEEVWRGSRKCLWEGREKSESSKEEG